MRPVLRELNGFFLAPRHLKTHQIMGSNPLNQKKLAWGNDAASCSHGLAEKPFIDAIIRANSTPKKYLETNKFD